ncbi:28S ribosomal protein S15, mitochondrial [Megachile rotundata]|uniref:28S ribosomal protein S15, mitochondrial n=1 Tax=Megachile rotundata TaxID=143995 RepID=UPI000258DC88|nr:PREDICTED: 28S ribosomal protein S15, mitochondrial [Megachile rotundata]
MSLAISCRSFGAAIKNVYMLGGYVKCNSTTVVENYKLKWERPKKVPFSDPKQSGDLGLDITAKPNEFKLRFEKSKELQDADDIVKKMFTLEFQRKKETNRLKNNKVMALVKRHVCDGGSTEVKIAGMTSAIHDLQNYVKEQPRNGQAKTTLKELIEKRAKYLRHLRSWDYPRYEWVLEQLNLVHKNLPQKLGPVTRKTSLRKVTEEFCNDIIQKKIDAFKVELKEEQKKFYVEKAEKLAFILKEEIECGLKPTVTEEQIEDCRKKAELLNKAEESHDNE